MTSTHFPLPINGEWEDDEIHFILHSPFVYVDDVKGITVTIPAGFRTDFNSAPEVANWYFNRKDYMKAGLVHDWLYKFPSKFESATYIPPLTRQQCDDIHRRILDLEGCRWSRRQAIYLALRVGGGVAWNRHRQEDTKASADASSSTSEKVSV